MISTGFYEVKVKTQTEKIKELATLLSTKSDNAHDYFLLFPITGTELHTKFDEFLRKALRDFNLSPYPFPLNEKNFFEQILVETEKCKIKIYTTHDIMWDIDWIYIIIGRKQK